MKKKLVKDNSYEEPIISEKFISEDNGLSLITGADIIDMEALLDSSPNLIACINASFHIIYANKQFADFWGIRKPGIIGKHLKEVIGEEHVNKAMSHLQKAFKGEKIIFNDTWQKGNPRHLELQLIPHTSSKNQIASITCQIIDYTDIKNAENIIAEKTKEIKESKNEYWALNEEFRSINEELWSSRQILETIYNESPVAISIITKEDCKYFQVNRHFEKFSGYNQFEIIGRTCDELNFYYNPSDRFMIMNKLQTDGFTKDIEIAYRNKNGTTFYGLTSNVIINLNNKLYVLSVIVDITDRNQAQKALLESQKMLELVINNIPVRVFWKDTLSNYLGCNNWFAKDAGLSSPAEIIGKTDHELNFNEADLYRADDRKVLESKLPKLDFEEPQSNPNGTNKWLRTSKVPLIDSNGDVKGVLGTYEDISEKKRIEEELKQKNEELNQFFNSNLDLLCIADIDGQFLRLNPEWEKTLGYKLSELLAQNFLDLIHPEDLAQTKEVLTDLSKQKEVKGFTNRYRCKDGSYKWIEWRSFPIGKYVYASARDITDRVNSEDKLKASENQFRELNATKDRFFSIIAHDLKSPFNAILGFAKLLSENIDSFDTETLRQIAQQLHKSSKTTYSLLDNLLEWVRSQTGRIENKPIKIKLIELIRASVSITEANAIAKKIVIEINVPEGLYIMADHNLTTTVLRNLITNAIKFSAIGSKIIISAKKEVTHIEISVTDFGTGISTNMLEKLFHIESKCSTPGTQNERGTGLGLILCKDFMEKQNGKIWVTSEQGKGSTFYIALPIFN